MTEARAPEENTPTPGERAVGLSFNPSGSEPVDAIKQAAAQLIDVMYYLASQEGGDEPSVQGMYGIAITKVQEASMWAVKAATWK